MAISIKRLISFGLQPFVSEFHDSFKKWTADILQEAFGIHPFTDILTFL